MFGSCKLKAREVSQTVLAPTPTLPAKNSPIQRRNHCDIRLAASVEIERRQRERLQSEGTRWMPSEDTSSTRRQFAWRTSSWSFSRGSPKPAFLGFSSLSLVCSFDLIYFCYSICSRFKLDANSAEPFYETEIEAMQHKESATMYVDFSHVMRFNDVLQKAISEEYLR